MLTDAEILTVDEMVNLIYDAKEFKGRVDEAIELIRSPDEPTEWTSKKKKNEILGLRCQFDQFIFCSILWINHNSTY